MVQSLSAFFGLRLTSCARLEDLGAISTKQKQDHALARANTLASQVFSLQQHLRNRLATSSEFVKALQPRPFELKGKLKRRPAQESFGASPHCMQDADFLWAAGLGLHRGGTFLSAIGLPQDETGKARIPYDSCVLGGWHGWEPSRRPRSSLSEPSDITSWLWTRLSACMSA